MCYAKTLKMVISMKKMINKMVLIVFALALFSVSAANYSIGKHVRDASNVSLNTGWNMFAVNL